MKKWIVLLIPLLILVLFVRDRISPLGNSSSSPPAALPYEVDLTITYTGATSIHFLHEEHLTKTGSDIRVERTKFPLSRDAITIWHSRPDLPKPYRYAAGQLSLEAFTPLYAELSQFDVWSFKDRYEVPNVRHRPGTIMYKEKATIDSEGRQRVIIVDPFPEVLNTEWGRHPPYTEVRPIVPFLESVLAMIDAYGRDQTESKDEGFWIDRLQWIRLTNPLETLRRAAVDAWAALEPLPPDAPESSDWVVRLKAIAQMGTENKSRAIALAKEELAADKNPIEARIEALFNLGAWLPANEVLQLCKDSILNYENHYRLRETALIIAKTLFIPESDHKLRGEQVRILELAKKDPYRDEKGRYLIRELAQDFLEGVPGADKE